MRRHHSGMLALGVSAVVGCATSDPAQTVAESGTATAQQAVALGDRVSACSSDPRVVAGIVSVDACVGADVFLREDFGGNGRTCATCHRVDRNFTIDPTFISKLPASDPLFVAEFDPSLVGLEIPAQMRARGLILENVDGFDPDPRTHFVLRSVPHNLSMATSVKSPDASTVLPVERTGWSGDGAPGDGSLKQFLVGAIEQHYTRTLGRVAGEDFRTAEEGELAAVDTFMRRLGRTNELALSSVAMSDAGAEAGRSLFLTVGCNTCHGNAGANASFGSPANRNFNTGVESSRHPDLAAFPHDGGFRRDPANPDGSFGDGTFNTPPLIEAADTGPFFHTATSVTGASAHNTDVATTIEEAIAFYDSPAFNASPAGKIRQISLTATDIDNLGRFLRGVNATFNAALATKRIDAASTLATQQRNTSVGTQRELLRLANVELRDALRVLSEVPDLDATSQAELAAAFALVESARLGDSPELRALTLGIARGLVTDASAKIGSNLTYDIGESTVMF